MNCMTEEQRAKYLSDPEQVKTFKCSCCRTMISLTKAHLKGPSFTCAVCCGCEDKMFVVQIDAYDGDQSSIQLTSDGNDTLGQMYCVGKVGDDGIIDLIDNGYPSLGELYHAWPELKPKCPECGSSKVAPTQGNGVGNTMDCLVCYTDFTPGKSHKKEKP